MIDLQDVKAGDLIGFCDRGPLGIAINLATWGIPGRGLSHVGIAAKSALVLDWPDASPLLFESTTLAPTPCLVSGTRTRGVQAHELRARIRIFPGRVWHYPLRRGMSLPGKVRLTDFCDYHAEVGTTYDALGAFRSRATPLGILEGLLCRSRENLSRLFCSEFVAAAWRECGIWDTPNASRWNPNSLARAAVRTGIVGPRRRLK